MFSLRVVYLRSNLHFEVHLGPSQMHFEVYLGPSQMHERSHPSTYRHKSRPAIQKVTDFGHVG